MPVVAEKRRPLVMLNPYPTKHEYIRQALDHHHREIGELQAQVAELRDLLREQKAEG